MANAKRMKIMNLSEWFYAEIKNLGPSKSISAHVDELGYKGLSMIEMVDVSVGLFKEFVDLSIKEGLVDNFIPELALSLEYSKKLELWDPQLQLEEQLDDTPPEFYLTHRDYKKVLVRAEQYKTLVTDHPVFKTLKPLHKNLHIYYDCIQTERSFIDYGVREYNRGIYIEYYPSHLVQDFE